MAMSQAVEDAAALLRQRLADARTEYSRLAEEIAQIEGALERLGFGRSEAPNLPGIATASEPEPAFDPAMTISAAVKILLDADEGPWTPKSAGERLREELPGIDGGRTNEKFYNAVGAAFYQMRKREEAVTDQFNRTRSVKWVENAEAPVAAGASDGEESSYGSSRGKGAANGTAPGSDHGSGDTDRDRNHGVRAPLDGALAL